MQLTYPGVYVTEIPSSVRPIATVSTSIAAFIDFFKQGPVGKAVQIFGMADFERIFGGLDDLSDASYQIAQFFLNGGPSAWVIRMARGEETASSIALTKISGGADAITASAINAGSWGNSVRFTVEPVLDPATNAVSTQLFNLYVARYASATDRRLPVAAEKYLNLSIVKTSPRFFESVVNASSQLVRLAASVPATPVLPAFNGTLGGAVNTTNNFNTFNGKTFTAKLSTASSTVTCTLDGLPNNKELRTLRAAVEAAIRANGTTDPGYANATVALFGDRLLIRAGRSNTYEPKQTIEIAGTLAGDLGFSTPTANVHEYVLGATATTLAQKLGTPGEDGDPPDAAEIMGDATAKTGLHALEDVDLFNLLCIPRLVAPGFNGFSAAIGAATAYCEARRAFMLVDIPETVTTPQQVQDWVDENASLVRSKNTALYFPRVQVADPKAEFRLRSIGASGTVAGVYARTDNDRGVWKAPAGVDATLRGVAALDYQLTDAENGVLNPLGINCLRTFPVYGQIAWGARTGVGADAMASEWKYVPIRRLALMIEESLFRGTKWVVFEPNDEPLWAKIRQNVGAFMMNLFRQGAFQGSTPDKAFFVKCDGETTTAADRNLGIVNIEVGFAPLKPAEFVVLKIQQIPDVQ